MGTNAAPEKSKTYISFITKSYGMYARINDDQNYHSARLFFYIFVNKFIDDTRLPIEDSPNSLKLLYTQYDVFPGGAK